MQFSLDHTQLCNCGEIKKRVERHAEFPTKNYDLIR